MEKFILESQNTASKCNRLTQILEVLLLDISLHFVASNKNLIARLRYDLDWNVSDSLIFTKVARLPNRQTVYSFYQLGSVVLTRSKYREPLY